MNIRPDRRPCSPTSPTRERQARVDLAAVYRLCAHYGWDDVIYNHCAMRVPGEDTQIPDEAARAAVDRGDGVEPREGRHARRPRRVRRRQPSGLHPARRRAERPAGRQLLRPRAHRDRDGARRPQARPAHGLAAGDALLPAHRLSPLRGHHRGFLRARAHPAASRQQPRADPAQSRPAHRRQDRARGVHPDEISDERGRDPAPDGSDRRRADRDPARRSARRSPPNTSRTTAAAARPTGRPICACSTRSTRATGIDATFPCVPWRWSAAKPSPPESPTRSNTPRRTKKIQGSETPWTSSPIAAGASPSRS